jgi:glucokinase
MNRFAQSGSGTACGIAVDMGASHFRFVLADEQAHVLGEIRDRVQGEVGAEAVVAQLRNGIARLIDLLPNREQFRGIAIGVPSAVHPVSGQVLEANNVPGWRELDLGRDLEEHFQVPVYLDNDANMAALGEHWRGAARGTRNFIFVAIGTGLGAGIFVDGRLYRGRSGNAGEIFRMNVDWTRWNDDFGESGYLESFVSGMGIAKEGRSQLSGGNGVPLASHRADERDARFVFEAMERGSAEAAALVNRSFTMLGVGVANLISVLDPELIVFNGGLVHGAPERMLATVETVMRRIHPNPPPVKLSTLGDRAQIWGALFTLLYPDSQTVIRATAVVK